MNQNSAIGHAVQRILQSTKIKNLDEFHFTNLHGYCVCDPNKDFGVEFPAYISNTEIHQMNMQQYNALHCKCHQEKRQDEFVGYCILA